MLQGYSSRTWTVTPVVLIAWLAATSVAPATEPIKHFGELLPTSTVAVVEVNQLRQLIDRVLGHPIKTRLEKEAVYQKLIYQPGVTQFRLGLGLVQVRLGESWQSALDNLCSRGATLAIDGKTQGVALLLRANSAEAAKKYLDFVVKLANEDAKNKKRSLPLQQSTYRDLITVKADGGRAALLGEWVLVTNNVTLGKDIADRYLDRTTGLSSQAEFQAAAKHSAESDIKAFLNIKQLRSRQPIPKQSENPLAELLIGGIMSLLEHADFATAGLSLTDDRLAFEMALPAKRQWIPEVRNYYFAAADKPSAPKLINVPGTIFSMSTYRDIGQMWLRSGDLYNQAVNDGIAQAENTLTTLFAGRDFATDILAGLKPQVQLVVARQSFEKVLPKPALKMPSFAMAFQLRDAKKMQSELRRTFQSLVGFLNVVGAMNGQPQLEQDIEKGAEQQYYIARYVPEVGEEKSTSAPVNFNFSPTLGFSGDYFVLSSTRNLAEQVLKAEAKSQLKPRANTQMKANGMALMEILRDNRAQLVANNMLEEGNSQDVAEVQIEYLLKLVSWVDSSTSRFAWDKDRVTFDLNVNFAKDTK